MVNIPNRFDITGEDLRAALKEMKGYVDITEEDLKKIYEIAWRYAEQRVAQKVAVRDVMTREVIHVRDDADITEVAELLSENRISGLPVVDGEGGVVGVITEADVLSMAGMNREHSFRDILRHILGEPLPSRNRGSRKIKDLMNSPAITTGPESDIREVARIMDGKRIKRVPVVDEQGRLIGVISRADIVRAIGRK